MVGEQPVGAKRIERPERKLPTLPVGTQRRSGLIGIGLMAAAAAIVSLNDTIVKWLSTELPAGEIIGLRAVAALMVGLGFHLREGGWRAPRIRSPRLQLLRGMLMVSGMYLFVTGLRYLPLADAVAILFAAPLFSVVLAVLVLRERLSTERTLAMLVGFTGILVMVRPTGAEFSWVFILPLGTALGGGLNAIITRYLRHRDSSSSTFLAGNTVVCMSAFATISFGWLPLSGTQLLLLGLAGVFVAFAEYFVIEAFRHCEVTLVAPFVYTSLIWAAVFGFLVFDAIPDVPLVAGAILVIGSGIFIFYREASEAARPVSVKTGTD